jgi:hypothetical protein
LGIKQYNHLWGREVKGFLSEIKEERGKKIGIYHKVIYESPLKDRYR